MGKCVNKLWYTYAREYYSAIRKSKKKKKRKSKLLGHATSWIDLEGIVLNEKSQFQKVTYCMILLILEIIKL